MTSPKTSKRFCAFIITHGRPDRVVTFETLKKQGYTGDVFLVVDDKDKTLSQYVEKYGDKVLVFSKDEIAKTFDTYDNFPEQRAIIYGRNACFGFAKEMGYEYFIELDDDYTQFIHRFDTGFAYYPPGLRIGNLDAMFERFVSFMESCPRIASIAMAQGWDFIGWSEGAFAKKVTLKRKCMNSFFCSTARPFQFVGKINEDVNTYTLLGSRGMLFFTANQVSLNQLQTQSNAWGMTELYLDSGTYVKSFYSVIGHPSSIHIGLMGSGEKRLHHKIDWKRTVPKIISQSCKKL